MACGCGSEKKVIITACSGAANTGLMADRVARSLRDRGDGSLICLAALGAELSGYVETSKAADLNVVVDGCPVGCGKKIYERLGIPAMQLVMTDFGAEKGKTVIDDALVARAADGAESRIAESKIAAAGA